MEGEFSGVYENWRTRVIEIIAFIEAFVDFPDEDIPQDLDIQAQAKVNTIIDEINAQLNNNIAERIRDGVVITILGKPNAGKSTLMNFLAKRDLAIVSDIEGTTRDVLEANMQINGAPVTLIDTAGIRKTNDKIEQEGVRRALEKADKSDFKIYIVDSSDVQIDKNLIDENTLVIFNKVDLVNEDHDFVSPQTCFGVIKVSVKEGEGTKQILDILSEIAEKYSRQSEAGIITRLRHRNLLNDTANNLQQFVESRSSNLPIEISAENLRLASVGIGKVIGKIGVEDVLDKIFSEFCIGK